MSDDPTNRHRPRLEALATAIMHGPGVLPPETRQSAAQNEGVPDRFEAYVDTIHRHAYRVTDEMVTGLAEAGADDDAVFEVSVASAFGAASVRLDAALQALRAARDGA
jgi:hypothetical protein